MREDTRTKKALRLKDSLRKRESRAKEDTPTRLARNFYDSTKQCIYSRSDETSLLCNNSHCNATTTVLSIVTSIKEFQLYVHVNETEFGDSSEFFRLIPTTLFWL